MGGFSWWHWVLVLVVVMVLFGGKGKVSDLMGDVAKGIKSFKKGLSDDTDAAAANVKSLDAESADIAKKTADKVNS